MLNEEIFIDQTIYNNNSDNYFDIFFRKYIILKPKRLYSIGLCILENDALKLVIKYGS